MFRVPTGTEYQLSAKQGFLAEAADLAAHMRGLDAERARIRSKLVIAISGGLEHDATQQQFATATGYSRQRISQFVNPPKPKVRP